ncbi:MAG: isoamylase early set domain-containing protein [Deltaproteobacteria bacterium]|nr:isoamylase early set domain-containing protein [Deltaproteobacteria bacterium]
MIIKKQFLKNRPVCKVTFGLSGEMTNGAAAAHLVGDFNNWARTATPMKQMKDGSFTVTIDLEKGREYQFRYLINENQWENAWNADRYVPTPFGDSENSVVIV